MTYFCIHANGKTRYYETLDAAKAVCEAVFKATGIVLGIEAVERKSRLSLMVK